MQVPDCDYIYIRRYHFYFSGWIDQGRQSERQTEKQTYRKTDRKKTWRETYRDRHTDRDGERGGMERKTYKER